MSSVRLLALGALLLVGQTAAGAQIDPFYLDLEREAQSASARGELAAAAKLQRVACFGMLDEPPRLAACTVRLAKAQAAVKDLEGFRVSFLRLATVEERFQGLSQSGLMVDELKEFARLAAARLSAANLALIPSLAALAAPASEAEPTPIEAKAARAKETKEKGHRRRTEAPKAVVEAKEPPDLALPLEGSLEDPSGTPPEEVEAVPVPPAAAEQRVDASSLDQERLHEARRNVAARPERAVLETELEAVRAIADRNAGDAASARLAGDLAYLLGNWPVCADYYQRAGDPGPDQPLGRFYMAVCLFETGQTEQAALLIAPSADRLKRSPFVDAYLSRILGRPGPS